MGCNGDYTNLQDNLIYQVCALNCEEFFNLGMNDDFKTLSDFFKSYGFTVSEETISGWMIHNGKTIKDEVADGVIELFDYLKSNGKDIVILTSWFSGTQIPRLKRTGLYDYIDKIVAGEDAMKPDLESFELAIGATDKEDCIMIGDSIKSDKVGAENAGIDYYTL